MFHMYIPLTTYHWKLSNLICGHTSSCSPPSLVRVTVRSWNAKSDARIWPSSHVMVYWPISWGKKKTTPSILSQIKICLAVLFFLSILAKGIRNWVKFVTTYYFVQKSRWLGAPIVRYIDLISLNLMSLVELTRNSFQGGISAQKVCLCVFW